MSFTHRFTFLLFLLFCVSCARSPIATGITADINLYRLSFTEIGMNQEAVACVAGPPEKRECVTAVGGDYEVWYYLTAPYHIEQLKPTKKNLTPFIFKDCTLAGIGYRYLHELQGGGRYVRRQEYHRTRPSIEDPFGSHGHRVISPPPYERIDLENLRDFNGSAIPLPEESNLPEVVPAEESPESTEASVEGSAATIQKETERTPQVFPVE